MSAWSGSTGGGGGNKGRRPVEIPGLPRRRAGCFETRLIGGSRVRYTKRFQKGARRAGVSVPPVRMMEQLGFGPVARPACYNRVDSNLLVTPMAALPAGGITSLTKHRRGGVSYAG